MTFCQCKKNICFHFLILFINLSAIFAGQLLSNVKCIGVQNKDQSKKTASFNSLTIDIGFGKAFKLFDKRETSAGLFIYYSRKNITFSIRSLGNMEYFLKAGPDPVESYSDLSLLLGYNLLKNEHYDIIPLIGVGKVRSVIRGKLENDWSVDAKHEKLVDNVLGFSSGIKFQVNSKYSSIGLYYFSNMNEKKSYHGILFCFGLGRFY